VETEEVHLMAEEEQKRQAVQAEDRLDMAHLRKGEPSAVRRSARKRRGKGE
jgi:circadian clock protein KaiC